MDDILVYSESFHGHAQHIEWTLGALSDVGFKIALEKSEFFLSEISFMGYMVTRGGLRPDSRKVAAVRDAPTPTSLTQVRAFLGLASYYRRFIKGFATIARPLTNLLRKDQPLSWNAEWERAFGALKEALATAPILIQPDQAKQFILITDWQPEAISAILAQQGNDGCEHVIEYASRTVPDERKNDSTLQGECYAVIWGIQHFHPYLYGHKFLLITDHEPLLALKRLTNYMGMIGHWVVQLQEYDFDIVHQKTERYGNADGLTLLHPPTKVATGEEITPLREPEPVSGPRFCLLEVASHWAEPADRSVEDEIPDDEVELLLIQGWRTDTEGYFLKILFGEVRDGHPSSITDELPVLLTQVLDDLPLEILSHYDERPGTATLARTLESHLLWSTCMELEEGSYYLPSIGAYLSVDVTDLSTWDPLIRRVPIGETSEEAEEEEEEETEEGGHLQYTEGEMTLEEEESGAESDDLDYQNRRTPGRKRPVRGRRSRRKKKVDRVEEEKREEHEDEREKERQEERGKKQGKQREKEKQQGESGRRRRRRGRSSRRTSESEAMARSLSRCLAEQECEGEEEEWEEREKEGEEEWEERGRSGSGAMAREEEREEGEEERGEKQEKQRKEDAHQDEQEEQQQREREKEREEEWEKERERGYGGIFVMLFGGGAGGGGAGGEAGGGVGEGGGEGGGGDWGWGSISQPLSPYSPSHFAHSKAAQFMHT
ncbi:hypothetical protein CBR_g22404 [Chara braunii]|uniref:Reverse transcriptase domain-containing protein n=1 Tax=Chara braunii TaxID=69332 RepID=A0A388JUX4_CHABU|nr:hypothetical protein CBR_g22404 [Chara braunii]|eukprot:GBG61606.1 hypothetical protein CBR_g22404 [Chara braunii]